MFYINFFFINILYIFNIILFQSQIDSSKFVSYICVQVLPHLSLMISPDGRDIQLELLKLLAELTVFCGTIEKPEDKVQQLYNTLIVSIVSFYSHILKIQYFCIVICNVHILLIIIIIKCYQLSKLLLIIYYPFFISFISDLYATSSSYRNY